MRIAVIEHSGAGDYADYISSVLDEAARQHDYQIKSWSNSVPAFQQQIATDAIIYIYIESTSALLLNWLYHVKIPSILKKIKAEIVLDLNGIASAKIKIPQLVAASASFFYNDVKQFTGIEKYALKNLQATQKNAGTVIGWLAQKAKEDNSFHTEKTLLLPFTAPEVFRTFEWHEKIMVKAQHAENKDFFVAVIEDNAIDDFVLLLQAFSKFKKWQQSNMQLLVFPKYESLGGDIYDKHSTYKFRDDVRLLKDIEEKDLAAIIASAHSFIHVSAHRPQMLTIAVAMQCSLPVISFRDEAVKEYAGDAVLFAAEKSARALGDAIIQLYKDENLYAQLKQHAQQQSLLLNRKACEESLWNLLQSPARI